MRIKKSCIYVDDQDMRAETSHYKLSIIKIRDLGYKPLIIHTYI